MFRVCVFAAVSLGAIVAAVGCGSTSTAAPAGSATPPAPSDVAAVPSAGAPASPTSAAATPSGPPGSVAMPAGSGPAMNNGNTDFSNDRTSKDITNILVANRDKFRGCYDQAHAVKPELQGQYVLTFTLNPDGSIKASDIDDKKSEMHDPGMKTCTLAMLQKLSFPVSKRGVETTISYPFGFKPGGAGKLAGGRRPMSEDTVRFFAATDVGRVRAHNEDNFLVDRKLGLFIVADGMGGHAAGEVASALAVRTVHEEVKRAKSLLDRFVAGQGGGGAERDVLKVLEQAVQRASARIHEEARLDAAKRGMGTTFSAMLLVANKAFIAHVGDSRIYLGRNGELHQVTEDHTVYNELIKRGKLPKEQIEKVAQKNAITRAVGVYERVEVDTLMIETVPGDAFLLCSDGLYGYFHAEDDLIPFLAEAAGEDGVNGLIDLANGRGGRDNITAVVLHVVGDEGEQRARRMEAKRKVIAAMPIFAHLGDRELLRVMQAAQVRAYKDGEKVISEGQQGQELFIVLEGFVRVVREGMQLSTLGPGEHFGEMALIRNVPRSATVESVGDAELIVVNRSDFFEILRKEHELAVKLLWQFLGVIADRLDQTSRDLTTRSPMPSDGPADEIFPHVDLEVDDEGRSTQPYGAFGSSPPASDEQSS